MSKTNNARNDDDYEVGYGRPPRAHQFQKGRSGDPKGRPRGAKSLNSILAELLSRKISVQENGRSRRVSVAEALIHGQVHGALRGDQKAVRVILDAMRNLPEPETHDGADLSQDDRRLIAEALERMAQAKSNPPGDMDENKS